MAGYYRIFIPDFAGIGKPLFDTLKDTHAEKFSTSEEVKQAVGKLKSTLSAYPVLQFPNFNEPFILETDASTIRLAAVLMQKINKNKVLISAASRTLIEAESNYSTVEREALAVVWGINYYRPYLFGRTLLVITDHCMKYLQQFTNFNSRIVRWILALQEYSFEVIYRSGDQNVVAYAFSRLPVTEEEQINALEDYLDEE